MEDTKRTRLRQCGQHGYEIAETEAACTGPAEVCTRFGPRAEKKVNT